MFATVSEELVAVLRRELDDVAQPYLWSDDEIYGFMTEGFDALLKKTEVVNKVLSLPFVAGTATVGLSAKVLEIYAVHYAGKPVIQRNTNDAGYIKDDYGMSGVVSPLLDPNSSGEPCAYVRDYDAKALRLIPTPNIDGSLAVQCRVTLGAAMEEGAALPTTDAQDLRAVLHYMKHLAYQKHDSATEDLDRSRFHLDHYNRLADMREAQLKNNRRAGGHIRMDSCW